MISRQQFDLHLVHFLRMALAAGAIFGFHYWMVSLGELVETVDWRSFLHSLGTSCFILVASLGALAMSFFLGDPGTDVSLDEPRAVRWIRYAILGVGSLVLTVHWTREAMEAFTI